MKIGVVTDFLDSSPSGIGAYISNLYSRILDIDSENEYVLIHQSKSDNPLYKKATELVIPLPKTPPKNIIRKNILLPKALEKEKIDILHETSQITPILVKTKCKRIITVHDVIPIARPTQNLLFRTYYRLALQRACSLADKIITVSNYSRGDIEARLGVPKQKISVIYECLSDEWTPESNPKMLENKYGVAEGKYMLHVGGYDPRKNLPTLIRAFKRLLEKLPDQKLALVGPLAKDHLKIKKLAETLGIAEHVKFTGTVSQEELRCLYTSASVCVLPSLYEGFGNPILESMFCGTPLVASNLTSIPEIVGDAGILVDSTNPDTLAEAIHRVITNSTLRRELIEKGFRRAGMFKIQNAAEQTLKIYNEVGK